ncbi:hypothetical protein EMPS_04071 [Entomortierella parvispora]|uniref:Protein kinase domain-containing protein n=1 Tax=Entomortierella parvispora TaxID=205924 RepID=A0A9P3H7S7_9FUNG|nr:hypothetical protein EMPS_04071 [Entomortierella parvispora]
MTSNILSLFCLVDTEATPFSVDIDPSKTVHHLKKAIKDEIPKTFDGIEAKDLTLWLVSIPVPNDDNNEVPIYINNLLETDKKKLKATTKLSKVFDAELPEDTIHIIVQRLDLISEFEFVQYVPPAAIFMGSSDREGIPSSWSVSSASPLKVTLWENFLEEILGVQLDEAHPQYDQPSFAVIRDYWVDTGLTDLLREDLGCLRVLPPQPTLARVGNRHASFGRIGTGIPDLLCRAMDENGRSVFLFPMEMKIPSVLASDDLVSDYNAGSVRAVHPLQQAYGYQWGNGYRYGMLSTHAQSWFMKRVGTNYDELLVSPGVALDDNDPTFLQTFLCFTRLVMSDRHRQLHQPTEEEVSSMRTKQENKHYKKKDKDPSYEPAVRKGGARSFKNFFQGGSNKRSTRSADLNFPPYDVLKVLSYYNDGAVVLRVSCLGKDVVVKKCDVHNEREIAKELLHEVAIYEELEELQGKFIPHVVFAGVSYGVEMVLATEFAGANIKERRLNEADRNKIREALKAIHEHGVVHGDLRLQNIVVQQENGHSKFFFIDFGRSFVTEDQTETQQEMEVLESLLH